MPFFSGNRLHILRNGVEIFPAMLSAVEAAQREILFLTFVYWTGDIAQRFANTLAERARAGVVVRVLLDAIGASQMRRELVETMEKAGVQVRWFRPPSWKLWRTDHRTHRKVLVCDDRVGFTGGVGIAEEWEGDARNPDEWRETHVRIEGPAVHGLRAAFLGNWIEPEGDPENLCLECIEGAHACGDVPLQVVRSTASVGWTDVATLIWTVLSVARERVRITTAYFVPDEATLSVLTSAAARGVDVQIIVPGPHMDIRVSQLAGQAVFQELLDAGVRLWSYQTTMIHAKVLTVDGYVACLGSANFNQRSMRQDDELCVTALHTETTALLDAHFDEDLRHCEELDLRRWRRRGPWQRVKEGIARVFSHEL